jgi:hypothetical protein
LKSAKNPERVLPAKEVNSRPNGWGNGLALRVVRRLDARSQGLTLARAKVVGDPSTAHPAVGSDLAEYDRDAGCQCGTLAVEHVGPTAIVRPGTIWLAGARLAHDAHRLALTIGVPATDPDLYAVRLLILHRRIRQRNAGRCALDCTRDTGGKGEGTELFRIDHMSSLS